MDQKKYKDAREGITAWLSDCLTGDTEPRGMFTHVIVVDDKDEHSIYCFMPPGPESTEEQRSEYMKMVFMHLAQQTTRVNTKETFLTQDRRCYPDQGTTLDSAITIYHWTKNVGWECGVIEYVCEGEFQIKPVVWNNEYWIGAMKHELGHFRLSGMRTGREMTLYDFVNREWDFPAKEARDVERR